MSAVNPLSAEFLYELYATALRQEPLCAVLARHMRKEYLPDRSFQQVQEAIAVHFKTYKTPPSYAVLAQTFHEDYDAIELDFSPSSKNQYIPGSIPCAFTYSVCNS